MYHAFGFSFNVLLYGDIQAEFSRKVRIPLSSKRQAQHYVKDVFFLITKELESQSKGDIVIVSKKPYDVQLYAERQKDKQKNKNE